MKYVKGGSAPATHEAEEHSNTGNKKKLNCDKSRKRMKNTLSEITVKYCTHNRMIDGTKAQDIT